MDLNILIVLVAVFNMIGDVFCIVITKSWLLESGVYFLSRATEYVQKVDLVLFSLIVLLHKLYYFTEYKVFLNSCIAICIFLTLFNAFYGTNWVLDPKSFFEKQTGNWKSLLNTPRLGYIQFKFRCCGFNKVGEEPTDMCVDSKSKGCLKQLAQRYSTNIRSSGVYALTSSACALFTIMVFVFIIRKKKAKNMHRGQIIN
jgi:hypothetical protein